MRYLRYIAMVAAVAFFAATAMAQMPLTNLDGQRVDIQAQDGKVVILAIGAGWLKLSEKQVPFTNALAKKYSGRNVVVYYVMTDSTDPKSKNKASDEELRAWVTKHGLTVTVLRDPDGAATLKTFGVSQLPSFVVLDKSGNKSGRTFGGIEPDYDITVPISKVVDPLL
jgi:thiol-disulfide isomerase/thioredoxin